MMQPDLFIDQARRSRPVTRLTSGEAARHTRPRVNELQERVFTLIRDLGADGATDDELQVYLQMNPSTQRPRRIELVEHGRVRASGVTRPTRSGRPATVWVAA
jgi:hypothetical protein